MANNSILNKARYTENTDEWYTDYATVESEISHYSEQFQGKVVLCNCDDPYKSAFTTYFLKNFNTLKLKKLICTSYKGSRIVAQSTIVDDNYSPLVDNAAYVMVVEQFPNIEEVLLHGDSIADLIKSYTPYASVVWALMEHSKDALVVNSRNSGIMQHDTASWGICGTQFDTVDRVSEKSRFFQTTLGDWLSTISTEERETFINSFFSVIEETNAKTIEDLTANWYKSTTAAIKLLTKLDSSIREHLFKAIQIIFEASRIPESHKEKE